VQKILVKPYNANHIEEEIKRAAQFDWRGMVFEPPDRVCQRLNISEDDYYKSLIRGAADVKEHVPPMNKLVGARDLRVFDEHLSAIQSIALNLGVSLLENAVESIQESLRDGKLDHTIYLINRLVPTARLMHHRALAHFGMTGSDEFPQDLFSEQREDPARKAKDAAPAKVAHTPIAKADPLDAMIHSPLGAFADDFKLLLEKPLFAEDEVLRVIGGPDAAAGVDEVLSSLRFLASINATSLENIAAFVRQMPGVDIRCIEIANALSPRGERVLTLEQAISVMGANLASCVVIPLAWLRASRRGRNPLRLESLARHNMALALLVRELAIKFSGTQEFAAAALAHNVGKWLLAIQYPGFFGMSMVLCRETPRDCLEYERKLFGIDSAELGARFIEAAGMSDAAATTARLLPRPDLAPEGEQQIITSMVNLACLLAQIKHLGFSGCEFSLSERDFITSPAWAALRNSQVNIPLDPPEYLSALESVINRVKMVIEIAFD